jgi:hypothetical protein
MSGGALNVYGTLSLGGVLTEGAGSITCYGVISGGTIDVTGGAFDWGGGTLVGVTYEGTLNLTASGATGFVANGLTIAGSNGGGPGTMNVTGNGVRLNFDNTQTFSDATINLGNSDYTDILDENDTADAGDQVLTLASSVTVDVVGAAVIGSSRYSGDGIVNDGAIDITGSPNILQSPR